MTETRYHLTEDGKEWIDENEDKALEYFGLTKDELDEILESVGTADHNMGRVVRECWYREK